MLGNQLLKQTFNKYQNPKTHFGRTLIELLITLTILSLVSIWGVTNLIALREKQALTNTAQQLKTEIDKSFSQSIAVTPNKENTPSSWSAGIFSAPGNKFYKLASGPFNDSGNINFNNPSSEIKIRNLPPQITFTSNWSSINSNTKFGVALIFEKFTGQVGAIKINPGNQIMDINPGQPQNFYNFSTDLEIIFCTPRWSQTIKINKSGQTILDQIQAKTNTSC